MIRFTPFHHHRAFLTAALAACGFAVLFASPTAQVVAADATPGPFAKAIEHAQARTVKIYGAGIGRNPGYATGIVVSADGQVLVAHGVYLAGERLRVELSDGAVHEAEVLRRSDEIQTVLLKIDAETPDYFDVSKQPVVEKGDWVLALSNAFKVATGREPLSVNLGVVSLRTELNAKRGTQDVPYEGEVLLIDAITSNPGAPGGALVTADGRLAGMVGKIIESKDTGTRLNYAVPSDLLAKFLAGESLAPEETPTLAGKPVIGVRMFTLSGTSGPAYIDRVVPLSPAFKAGLKPDDLVLSVGGELVRSVRDYQKIEPTLAPGKPVEFLVKRKQELVRVTITPDAEKKP